MRWPWGRHGARPIKPRWAVSSRAMELETAKAILAEVFDARRRTRQVKLRRRTHAQQAAGHPRRRRMKVEPG